MCAWAAWQLWYLDEIAYTHAWMLSCPTSTSRTQGVSQARCYPISSACMAPILLSLISPSAVTGQSLEGRRQGRQQPSRYLVVPCHERVAKLVRGQLRVHLAQLLHSTSECRGKRRQCMLPHVSTPPLEATEYLEIPAVMQPPRGISAAVECICAATSVCARGRAMLQDAATHVHTAMMIAQHRHNMPLARTARAGRRTGRQAGREAGSAHQ